ncbi:MAG: hypothetical protein ACFHXK_20740 [bacterium]
MTIFLRSLGLSLAGAVFITAAVTLWEWWENPSGIYHDGATTDWQIVYETAISWFLPAALYLFVVMLLLRLSWRAVDKLRARLR